MDEIPGAQAQWPWEAWLSLCSAERKAGVSYPIILISPFPKRFSGARRRTGLVDAFSGRHGSPEAWLWSCRGPDEDTVLAAEMT